MVAVRVGSARIRCHSAVETRDLGFVSHTSVMISVPSLYINLSDDVIPCCFSAGRIWGSMHGGLSHVQVQFLPSMDRRLSYKTTP